MNSNPSVYCELVENIKHYTELYICKICISHIGLLHFFKIVPVLIHTIEFRYSAV